MSFIGDSERRGDSYMVILEGDKDIQDICANVEVETEKEIVPPANPQQKQNQSIWIGVPKNVDIKNIMCFGIDVTAKPLHVDGNPVWELLDLSDMNDLQDRVKIYCIPNSVTIYKFAKKT